MGLGSNLHNPKQQLTIAISHINELPKTQLKNCSTFYETKAISSIPQDNYLNAAIHCQTSLTPLTLLYKLQNIEQKMGRAQIKRWGPRIIDIDLLLYNNIQLDFAMLTLPHPQLFTREFVLKPLSEIYKLDTHNLMPGHNK